MIAELAMKTNLTLDFVWIPPSLGGHSHAPYKGMRLTIRWQRQIEAYLQCARDIECHTLRFDTKTSHGTAICTLSSDEPVPPEWLCDGELIELLNGFRVLAVGRISRNPEALVSGLDI